MVALLAPAMLMARSLSLSSTCSSFITSFALSDSSSCLSIGPLIPLVTQSSSASIIPPISSWLSSFCVQSTTCSNSTLTELGNNITTSCKSDLEGLGLGDSEIALIPMYLGEYFSDFVEGACTRDDSSSTPFCVTSTLDTLQASTGGNITTSNFVSAFASVLTNSTLESELLCTKCVEGIYSELRPAVESSDSSLVSTVDSYLNGVCGNGFVYTNGSEPAGIVVATGTLATQTPSGSPAKSSGAAKHGAVAFVSMGGMMSMGLAGMMMGVGALLV